MDSHTVTVSRLYWRTNRSLIHLNFHTPKLNRPIIRLSLNKGGNADLVSKFKGGKLDVCGGYERVQAVTKIVKQNDVIRIGGIEVTCHATPCHTSGHICYFANKPGSGLDPCVFTGGTFSLTNDCPIRTVKYHDQLTLFSSTDTLFQAGCGKFFEGTADQMYDALINKLSKLPDNTVSRFLLVGVDPVLVLLVRIVQP